MAFVRAEVGGVFVVMDLYRNGIVFRKIVNGVWERKEGLHSVTMDVTLKWIVSIAFRRLV